MTDLGCHRAPHYTRKKPACNVGRHMEPGGGDKHASRTVVRVLRSRNPGGSLCTRENSPLRNRKRLGSKPWLSRVFLGASGGCREPRVAAARSRTFRRTPGLIPLAARPTPTKRARSGRRAPPSRPLLESRLPGARLATTALASAPRVSSAGRPGRGGPRARGRPGASLPGRTSSRGRREGGDSGWAARTPRNGCTQTCATDPNHQRLWAHSESARGCIGL